MNNMMQVEFHIKKIKKEMKQIIYIKMNVLQKQQKNYILCY